jgi:hypothetical protein
VIYRAPSARTLVSVTVLACVASATIALARPVEMTLDGERIESDVPPITTSSNRAYVPVRSFAAALGAQTLTDGDADGDADIARGNAGVNIVRGNQSLRLKVGDVHASINGMPLTLRRPPFLVRGRVMVELDALARAFNVRAVYDPRTARIDVLTPGIGQTASSRTEPPQ